MHQLFKIVSELRMILHIGKGAARLYTPPTCSRSPENDAFQTKMVSQLSFGASIFAKHLNGLFAELRRYRQSCQYPSDYPGSPLNLGVQNQI